MVLAFFVVIEKPLKTAYFLQLLTNQLTDWNDLYTKMFVVSPIDFCKFDFANAHEMFDRQKGVNLDTFKICTFFTFEAKLLEIEAEDTIRFLHYVQVFSIQKTCVEEKI